MHLGGWSLVIIHHLECFMQPRQYSCSCLSTVHSNHRCSNIGSVRPWTMNGATAYFVGVYLFMQPVVFMTLLRGRENNKYQAEMKYEERILTNRGFKVLLRSHPRHRSLLLALLGSKIWITSNKALIVKHHPRHHRRKHQAPRHCQGRSQVELEGGRKSLKCTIIFYWSFRFLFIRVKYWACIKFNNLKQTKEQKEVYISFISFKFQK